jgi:hypothetical protein
MLDLAREVLTRQRTRQAAARSSAGDAWGGGDDTELVFTTSSGLPIEPRNFVRSFQRICGQHNIRLITVHQVRHTTATLLKNLGVPARDAQLILGHSDIAITQQIYQHDNMVSRRESLTRVETALQQASDTDDAAQAKEPGQRGNVTDGNGSRQLSRQATNFVDTFTSFLSGRGSGTRTCDTWFWSSNNLSLENRLTSVNLAIRDRRRAWLLGCVAVNLAVKT